MFVVRNNQQPHFPESRGDGMFGEPVSYDAERLVVLMSVPNMSPLRG